MKSAKSNFKHILNYLFENGKIEEFFDMVFVRSESYNEKVSATISQMYIEMIIDEVLRGSPNGYKKLEILAYHQKKFGLYNGGCLLYDFLPRDAQDELVLTSNSQLKHLIAKNKLEALESDDPTLREVYPICFHDPEFSKIFLNRCGYPINDSPNLLQLYHVPKEKIDQIISDQNIEIQP